MTRLRPALVLALSASALSACAQTNNVLFGVGECHLQQLGQAPLEVQHGLDLVTVQINGKPLRLVLDTGAETSMLSPQAADRLDLGTDTQHATRSYGVGGPTARQDATVDSFLLAGLRIPVSHIAVGDLNADSAGTPDGLLGTDVLRYFDLDIDPAARRLTLYRGEPCWLTAPPWSEHAVAIGGVLGVRSGLQTPRELLIPVVLDGTKAQALFDTGAQASAVDVSLAEDIGIKRKALAADPTVTVGGAGPDVVVLPVHRFHTFQVGSWLARDPDIPVLDVPPPEQGDVLVNHPRWQAVIGQDLLHNHRLWVSMAGWQIFLSEPDAVIAK